MKKSLVLLMTLTPLIAFSQVVDYDVVNQRNADRINSEYTQAKAEKRSKIAKFFTVGNTNFPKVEKYNGVEKNQINLLSCMRKLIQKYKGGYDGPAIAQKILLSAMDGASLSTDSGVLNQAESTCNDAYQNLYNFKKKAIDEMTYSKKITDLMKSTEAEVKTAKVIRAINSKKNVACKVTSVGAEVHVAIGVGVGVNSIKCLRSDARVVKYVGVDGRLGLAGIGAFVNVGGGSYAKTGDAVAVFQTIHVEGEFYAIGLSHIGDVKYRDGEETLNLGAGVIMGGRAKNGIAVRTFNGKARWSTLLNILK